MKYIYQGEVCDFEIDNPHLENNENWYELKMLEFIKKNHGGGVYIDAGAYVGTHSVFFAKFCHAIVHAFEPVYIKQLRRNIEVNNVDNRVSVHECGLSDKEGEMGWYDRSNGSNSAATSLIKGTGIKVYPLDDFDITPKVIKIDVENMEHEVILGAINTIKKHKPVIFAELFDNVPALELLKSLGYTQRERFNATPTYRFTC